MTVYRETKDGAGYRKIQEFAEEKSVRAGILWKKTRVYKVVWEQEGEVKGRFFLTQSNIYSPAKAPHWHGDCPGKSVQRWD